MALITPVLGRICLRLAGSLLGVCLFIGAALAQQGSIVVLGDSNTAGFGVGAAQAFPSQLNEMLQRRGHPTRVVNAGVSGDTLGGMLGRLNTSVPAGTRLVIVQGGYNDAATGTPPDVIVARMKSILAQLRARRITAVLCGFFHPEWDAIGRKVAATYGATFLLRSAQSRLRRAAHVSRRTHGGGRASRARGREHSLPPRIGKCASCGPTHRKAPAASRGSSRAAQPRVAIGLVSRIRNSLHFAASEFRIRRTLATL